MTTRTDADRRSDSAYDRRRRRHIRNGTWLHPVPTDRVRQHVAALSAAGMSLAAIARAAELSPATVWPIARAARPRYVHGPTAAALMSVAPPAAPPLPAGMVDITGTSRRLQALVALGYSISDLSRRLGYKNMQQVWEWTRRRQSALSETSAGKVRSLYEQLSGTPGASTRARNDARRNGWLPPLAWDDDIDDPDALPDLGEECDDIVDAVAIRKVLAGQARFRELRPAEQVALFRDHAAGVGTNDLMAVLHMSASSVARWRAKAATEPNTDQIERQAA